MNKERSISERILRGTGILMTVFGALETVVFLVYLGAIVYFNQKSGSIFSGGSVIVGAGLFLGGAVTELIAGVLGFRCVKTGASTIPGFVFCVLCLGLTAASLILLGREIDALTVVSVAICAVVPAVYLWAALKTRSERAAESGQLHP